MRLSKSESLWCTFVRRLTARMNGVIGCSLIHSTVTEDTDPRPISFDARPAKQGCRQSWV